MRQHQELAVVAVVAVILVGGFATTQGLSDSNNVSDDVTSESTHDVTITDSRNPDDFTRQCASGMSGGGTIDVFGPESAVDAKDWPRTPRDAAQRTLDAPVFAGFEAPVLGVAEPVARPGSLEGAKPNAVRFDVFESEALVGRITVEEMGFGAYATTFLEECASGTPGRRAPAAVDLPTSNWRPGEGGDGALIEGVLSVDDDNCVYLNCGDYRASRLYVVWPAGFTATLDASRHLTLFDGNGDPVARSGDRLRMGGSYAAHSGVDPCLPISAIEVATVMSEVEVQHP